MDNRQFWSLVRSRWLVIVAFILVGLVVASAYVIAATPSFVSSAELFVAASGGDNTIDLAQGGNFSQQQARNYSAIVNTDAVLDPVVSTLGLSTTSSKLAAHVSATVPLNTSVISISVDDATAAGSAAIANAVAASLVNVITKVAPTRSDGTTPVKIQIVQRALVPTHASGLNVIVVLLLGLLLGLIVGVIIVLLRELALAPLRTAQQAETVTGAPLLGSVVKETTRTPRLLESQHRRYSLRAEQYRQIGMVLRGARVEEEPMVVMITSSVGGEGKSTVAAQVAVALAAGGTSVCLVDADLRGSTLATYLQVDDGPGLARVLDGTATMTTARQRRGKLSIFTGLSAEENAGDLLASPRAAKFFSDLRTRFEVVLIDAPALLPVADSSIIASYADTALLVISSGSVRASEVDEATRTLSSLGIPLVGVILNRVPAFTFARLRRGFTKNGHESSTDHTAAEIEKTPSI